MNKTTLVSIAMVLACTSNAPAATILAADIATAAAGTTTGTDLGTLSVSTGGLTVTSTGDARNLGGDSSAIGIVGGLGAKDATIAQTEELTLGFASTVNVQSMTITGHGKNDLTAVIGGFASDPGASVSGLPSGWTVTYDAIGDTVSIASNNNSGFLSSYVVSFANSVDVTALTLADPTVTDSGAAGVGFGGITFIPEPSSSALLGLGGLALILRRRK